MENNVLAKAKTYNKTDQILQKPSSTKSTEEKKMKLATTEGQRAINIKINSSISSICFLNLGEKVINIIMTFLSARDLIKYASLSWECRKQLPLFLQKNQQDNSTTTPANAILAKEKWTEKNRKMWRIQEFIRIQEDYKNLLSLCLPEIEAEIQEKLCDLSSSNSKKKSGQQNLIEILAIGVSMASKTPKSNSKVVEYILKVGLRKAFEGIEKDHVTSYSHKITLPLLEYDALTPLIEFSGIVVRFIYYTEGCIFDIKTQRDLYKSLKRLTNKETQQKQREKLMQIYKPIIKANPNVSIVDYINQNNLQVITSFLSTTEISHLIQTNKSIGSMVEQGIKGKIQLEKLNREAALAKAKMSPQLAKAHLYLKHIQRYFNDREEDKNQFNPKIKVKLLKLILNETNLNDFSYPLRAIGDNQDYFSMGKSIWLKFPKHSDVLSILQQYPNVQAIRDNLFEKDEKEQYIKQNYQYLPTRELIATKKLLDSGEHFIHKQVMLMYQFLVGMEMLRSVPKSEQPVDFEANDQVYEAHLYQYDTAIHCYEKLIKTNTDELLLLSMKPKQFEYKYEPMYFGN